MPAPANPLPLDKSLAQRLIAAGLDGGGDFAEVFCEYGRSRSLSFEEGKVKSAHSAVSAGIAIRVVAGEATGHAYCETLDDVLLLAAAKRAGAIARAGGGAAALPLAAAANADRYPLRSPLAAIGLDQRIALLRAASAHASGRDPRVSWVSVALADSERWLTVAASDGTWGHDYQPMLRLNLSVIVREGDRRERGYASVGGRAGLELLARRGGDQLADEAVAMGVRLLGAVPCPAGPMPVVLAAGGAGVLIHEAVGHGLEADFNRKQVSTYAGKVGELVASPLCTVVDDGTVTGNRGAINIDDEGTPGARTVLIENGRLRGYLTDKLNARLMKSGLTGSGRRESYRALPIPRMRCTFLAGGADDPAEILAGVKRGIYAKQFGGGSVNISRGDYNFEVTEAWLIEDGKLTAPLRGATLVGNGPETLRRVTRVGNDPTLSLAAMTCGKEGQSCPVGFGTPTLLVSELTVGGTGK